MKAAIKRHRVFAGQIGLVDFWAIRHSDCWADCLGFAVPSTQVISRNVRRSPLAAILELVSLGSERAHSNLCWQVHDSPRLDRSVWLLAREDPDGKELASVLSQEGVRAQFSGASIGSSDGEPIIEGVSGVGSEFMLGLQPAQQLPLAATLAVKEVLAQAIRLLGGTIKLEWALDGDVVWILQMQQLDHEIQDNLIVPGDADEFRRFDATPASTVLENSSRTPRTRTLAFSVAPLA
jgi:hypothetical protein